MNNISKHTCIVSTSYIDDLIDKLELDNNNAYSLVSVLKHTNDIKKFENLLNSFNYNIIYDVELVRVENDVYHLNIIKVDNSVKNKTDKKDSNSFKNSTLVEDFLKIGNPFEENVLPKREVDNPVEYNISSIKDIINAINSENLEYFLADFKIFLKSILMMKTTEDFINKSLSEEDKLEIFDKKTDTQYPDSFNWIDDGLISNNTIFDTQDINNNTTGKFIFDKDGFRPIDTNYSINLTDRDIKILKSIGIDINNLSDDEITMLKKLGINLDNLNKNDSDEE